MAYNTGNVSVDKGSLTSKGGFIHGNLTVATNKTKNDYILLAGGGTKALSDFGLSNNTSFNPADYVTLAGTETISGIKTFSHSTFGAIILQRNGSTNAASVIFKNSNGVLGSVGMTNSANGGLQRWTADTSTVYTIWDSGNDGSGSGLDADKLDGQEGSYYLDYNNFTNKPTIPAAQVQSNWNQTNTSALDYIKNKPTIPTVPSNVVTGSGLTANSVIVGNGNSTIKDSGISLSTKGNASTNTAVVRPSSGAIHSVYYVFTEGETARASWGYNATTDCVELAWR
jgi:hypothetical protein